MKNKVYIAGPMTGYEQFNIGSFFAAGDYFKDIGWEVYNPAEKTGDIYGMDLYEGDAQEFDLAEAFTRYTDFIINRATHIYMLRGWEKSAGARAEHALAVVMGLTIIYEQGS